MLRIFCLKFWLSYLQATASLSLFLCLFISLSYFHRALVKNKILSPSLQRGVKGLASSHSEWILWAFPSLLINPHFGGTHDFSSLILRDAPWWVCYPGVRDGLYFLDLFPWSFVRLVILFNWFTFTPFCEPLLLGNGIISDVLSQIQKQTTVLLGLVTLGTHTTMHFKNQK